MSTPGRCDRYWVLMEQVLSVRSEVDACSGYTGPLWVFRDGTCPPQHPVSPWAPPPDWLRSLSARSVKRTRVGLKQRGGGPSPCSARTAPARDAGDVGSTEDDGDFNW
ncbi:unnamed protein product [Arctogadus glacialis]